MEDIKLTLKQRKFIKYYLETGNISQSALKAGYKHREQGFETLSNLINKGVFDQLLEKHGLTDKKIALVIKKGLEINDYNVRHKYLETLIKLRSKRLAKEEEKQTDDWNQVFIKLIRDADERLERKGFKITRTDYSALDRNPEQNTQGQDGETK